MKETPKREEESLVDDDLGCSHMACGGAARLACCFVVVSRFFMVMGRRWVLIQVERGIQKIDLHANLLRPSPRFLPSSA